MNKQNTIGLKEYTDAQLLAELVDRGVLRTIIGDIKPVIKTDDIQDDVDVSYVIVQAENYQIEEQNQRIQEILGAKE